MKKGTKSLFKLGAIIPGPKSSPTTPVRSSGQLSPQTSFKDDPQTTMSVEELRMGLWEAPPSSIRLLSLDLEPLLSRTFLTISQGDGNLEDKEAEAEVIKRKAALEEGPELDKKREFIAKELLYTEEQFVQSLETIIGKYYKPMLAGAETDPSIPKDLLKTIFSTIEILLPLNQEILSKLKVKLENWSNSQLIGDMFLETGPFLNLYTMYSSGFGDASAALETIATQSWFPNYCEAKVHIESLLIKPVQRLPRYSMLLEDLWKNTLPTHPDDENLRKAIDVIKKVTTHLNSHLARHKNFDKLTSEGLVFLCASHRNLLLDEIVTTEIKHKQKPYKVMLFNDIIVFMDASILKKKKKEPKDVEMWPLTLTWIRGDKKTMFIYLTGPCNVFILQLQTEEEYERWLTELSKAIEADLKKTQPMESGAQSLIKSGSARSLEERKWVHSWNEYCIYDGWWNHGKMHGKGTLEVRGSIYVGDFVANKKEGLGTMQFVTGQIYCGNWKQGKPHGYGEMVTSGIGNNPSFPSHDRYIGNWLNGMKHDKGVMIWRNGDRYTGTWLNDTMNGSGILSMASGGKYEGEWFNGMFQGMGNLVDNSGEYTGEFLGGLKSGQGTMSWKSGIVYTGMWKGGQPNGTGKLYDRIGFYDGDFEKGRRKGKGVMGHKGDSASYKGQWADDMRSGKIVNLLSLTLLRNRTI
eukprot:TRINITY_DN5841_c0_g1_i2.p1 TRINITY_DN5841_c0_g1~~TRINITY_DN5841_c0_g1_i2.p1  ORF type:complete len:692 (+),score=104.80 TRINITY_DN5841_c0_g1_i2:21-2096(+)